MDILYQTILILHVLGACIVLGGTSTALFLTFKKAFDLKKPIILNLIGKLNTFGIIILLISGIFLFSQNQQNYVKDLIFVSKIGLFLFDGLMAKIIIEGTIQRIEEGENVDTNPRKKLIYLFGINLITIIVIVALGKML